jgi:hypothetical protein
MAMAFDPPSGRLLVFGGSSANYNYSDDTWSWDGKSWTIVPETVRPSPRNGVGLSYDRANQALLLFGGAAENPQGGPAEAGILLGDTWTLAGGGWNRLSPGSAPSARSEGAMAYDARGHRLILFSGSAGPFSSETWAWGGTDWKLLHPSQAPTPRTEAAIAADPAGGSLVLFGGLADTPCR